jgi:hypothetical protein
MAIKVTYSGQGKDRQAKVDIDNGDLQALTQAVHKYGFIDEQALIRYALVALLNSDDNNLYVKKGEAVAALKVNENLLKAHHTEESDNANGQVS